MSDPLRLVIGALQHARLTILPSHRPHAESAEPWDRDWILARAELQHGGFHGTCEGGLRAEDLAAFQGDLRRLHGSLTGVAVLAPRDPWLALTIRAVGHGRLEANSELREGIGFENRLAVRLDLDQTELPTLLQALDRIVAAFPATSASVR